MAKILVIAPLLPDAFVFLPKKDLQNSRADHLKNPDPGNRCCYDAHLPGKSGPLFGKGDWDGFFSHIVFVPHGNSCKDVAGFWLVGFIRKEVTRKEYQKTNGEQKQKNALQDSATLRRFKTLGRFAFSLLVSADL